MGAWAFGCVIAASGGPKAAPDVGPVVGGLEAAAGPRAAVDGAVRPVSRSSCLPDLGKQVNLVDCPAG
jgi:hypothetical protein